MFKREIKKQFNENKYNVLTAKGKTPYLLFIIRGHVKIPTG